MTIDDIESKRSEQKKNKRTNREIERRKLRKNAPKKRPIACIYGSQIWLTVEHGLWIKYYT